MSERVPECCGGKPGQRGGFFAAWIGDGQTRIPVMLWACTGMQDDERRCPYCGAELPKEET